LTLHVSMTLKQCLEVPSPEGLYHIYWGNLYTSSFRNLSENCGT